MNIDATETFDAEIATAVDLDGDGKLDVVLQGGGQLVLFFSSIPQRSPGSSSSP